jgi:hypothetical protein
MIVPCVSCKFQVFGVINTVYKNIFSILNILLFLSQYVFCFPAFKELKCNYLM